MNMLENIPWRKLIDKVIAGKSLDEVEATQMALWLAEENDAFEGKKKYLHALNIKGESVEEVYAFARTFRDLARRVEGLEVPPMAIDIVGTGGDKSGTFNISSAASLIVATAGVKVMKHGNRSITSESGSADFLAGIGIPVSVPDEKLIASLETLDYCFFYAPSFHPTFKAFMAVRKALAAEGHKTVFNILGPLINPADPPMCLLGVFAEKWVPLLAQVLERLGVRRGLVVHCALPEGGGLDELSTAGRNRVRGVGELREINDTWRAGDFGLPESPRKDLLGGNSDENQILFENVLNGTAPRGLRDTILLNVAASFWIAKKVESIGEGIALGDELLSGGAVKNYVKNLRAFYRE